MTTYTNYITLPLNQDLPWYSFTTTLDGTRYTLTARYNTRMDRWLLDIADASGTPIVSGIPLLIKRNLTKQYTSLALPPGMLCVIDSSPNDAQPTKGSFLVDHALLYVT